VVIERAGNRCEYCGPAQTGQETAFQIDHVVPAIGGGNTSFETLALAGSVADRYNRLQRKTLHLTGIASRGHRDEPMVQF